MRAMSRLFVKKLTVIDFSYLHSERGLLGESWLVDVELAGNLDQQGMVLDFADVKKTIKRLIDDEFDHKLIIPALYSGNSIISNADRIRHRFETGNGQLIEHSAPASACCFLQTEEITPDSLAQAITEKLKPLLPDNVEDILIKLYAETIEGAYYHYSHGLRQHAGNCQRIAHGHRSRIEIIENGKRSIELENYWAKTWRDIYIGCSDDLVTEQSIDHSKYLQFSYQSCQGTFDLLLPASRCYLVDTDSTVENLARHLLEATRKLRPGQDIVVRAFEGVDKGAIESSSE
jgi:6-pyruvoyl-tetrahydropterin synthase